MANSPPPRCNCAADEREARPADLSAVDDAVVASLRGMHRQAAQQTALLERLIERMDKQAAGRAAKAPIERGDRDAVTKAPPDAGAEKGMAPKATRGDGQAATLRFTDFPERLFQSGSRHRAISASELISSFGEVRTSADNPLRPCAGQPIRFRTVDASSRLALTPLREFPGYADILSLRRHPGQDDPIERELPFCLTVAAAIFDVAIPLGQLDAGLRQSQPDADYAFLTSALDVLKGTHRLMLDRAVELIAIAAAGPDAAQDLNFELHGPPDVCPFLDPATRRILREHVRYRAAGSGGPQGCAGGWQRARSGHRGAGNPDGRGGSIDGNVDQGRGGPAEDEEAMNEARQQCA